MSPKIPGMNHNAAVLHYPEDLESETSTNIQDTQHVISNHSQRRY